MGEVGYTSIPHPNILRRMTLWRNMIQVGLLVASLLIAALPTAVHADNADNVDTPGRTPLSQSAGIPPLPLLGPRLLPVEQPVPDSPVLEGDVDKRTTAFIPHNLDMLTPIDDMPVDEARWIRVDLSEQMVVAYERNKPVRAFIISSGLPGTPTVTGTFHIRMKVRSQTMEGGDPALNNYYNLPNVQWVQYFYADYSFHGTYWHNNFGNPMSHGCINMTNADAKWLFDWAGPSWDGKSIWLSATGDNPGTLVIVTK